MAGLLLVPSIPPSSCIQEKTDNSIKSLEKELPEIGVGLIRDEDFRKSCEFLKKSFLLAKQHGKTLIENSTEDSSLIKREQSGSYSSHGSRGSQIEKQNPVNEDSFFGAISFLGGTFGFEGDAIYDPVQGGFAGLVKTASLEWKGVTCRCLDLAPSAIDNIEDMRAAASIIMSSRRLSVPDRDSLPQFIEAQYIERRDDLEAIVSGVETGIRESICFLPQLMEKEISDSSNLIEPHCSNSGNRKRDLQLNNNDVVVITGGARGVTAECAAEIAARFHPSIALVGRSAQPENEADWLQGAQTEADIKKAVLANYSKFEPGSSDSSKKIPSPMELQKICNRISAEREIRKNLRKIESASSKVKYYSADIRDSESVRSVFQKITGDLGKISCLIHGAGVLEDRFIVDKTEEQFSSVFDTKIEGMKNIIEAANPDHLHTVIFFSSVAARTGNAGQVDYSIANEVLNKSAQHFSRCTNGKCRFLSVNWGPWEGGMVTESLKRAFLNRGIELIPLKEGAQYLAEELQNNSIDIEVVIGASLLPDITGKEKNRSSGRRSRTESKNRTGQKNRIDEVEEKDGCSHIDSVAPLFSRKQLIAFTTGNPSEAFGEKYRIFDNEREMARLPGIPYFFMDRIVKADARQWEMVAGGWIECQYEMAEDEWFFRAGHTDYLPFCILLEIALQPCGWLAAYVGSALKSSERLYFRNLGGEAELIKTAGLADCNIITKDNRKIALLTMRARMTSVSHAGGLIIQNFDMEVYSDRTPIYIGKTNFGFFTAASLANQTGIKNSDLVHYINEQDSNASTFSDFSDARLRQELPIVFKPHHPITPDDSMEDRDISITGGMPSKAIRMVDTIEIISPDGGKYGKGFIKGSKNIDPEEWFFKAHFYQDPVCPGSLGVESFLQIIKVYTIKVWDYDPDLFELVMTPHKHKWIYRGQITPSAKKVEISAHIKNVYYSSEYNNLKRMEEGVPLSVEADGVLSVDGMCIYQMENFQLSLVKKVLRE